MRILIVDDEPLAQAAIRFELERYPEAELVGECRDGHSAIQAIEREKPDLVFLDIKMPECDGFEVVRQIGPENMPAVIFVTAFDQYAIQAFEAQAIDYLLKPFNEDRFDAAFARAREWIRNRNAGELNRKLLSLLEEHMGADAPKRVPPATSERLTIKVQGRVVLLDLAEIEWIEAANSYVRIHTARRSHLLRSSIGGIEQRLDPTRFVRIHRSAIVNLNFVRELRPLDHGDYEVLLSSGQKLRTSRRRREEILHHFRLDD